MAAKIIKLGKKEDIADAIRKVKESTDADVTLELEKGSPIFGSSENLKLIKKTGQVLGKKVKISTTDEVGQALAKKASMLSEKAETESKPSRMTPPRVSRSDIKPRFSDIMVSRRPGSSQRTIVMNQPPAISPIKAKTPVKISSSSSSGKFNKLNSLKPNRKSNFSKYFILALVLLVVAVFALAVLLPKATITVSARSEPITRDFEILVDKTYSVADPSKLQIPGMLISKEISETQNFTATGESLTGTKASGSVVIHNLTANTLTLRAATTALVANGKRYTLAADATGIKPNNGVNAAIKITAEQAGESSNLPAQTRFEIVNQALGTTNQVYAISSTAITGGVATSSTVLSQADIDKATAELVNKVLARAEADLTAENSMQIKLVENGVTREILAKAANKDVGQATEDFDMTLIAKISGLAMKQDDITSVIVAKINEVLSSDKYLVQNAEQKMTATFKSVDLAAGRGVLAVHFETTVAYKVENENLVKVLSGKNESEIKEILSSKPEIDDVKVEFWPKGLVHKAPRLNGKIYINTVLSPK